MSDEKPAPEWKRRSTGLYVPDGIPDGGRRPTVGFARALDDVVRPKNTGRARP